MELTFSNSIISKFAFCYPKLLSRTRSGLQNQIQNVTIDRFTVLKILRINKKINKGKKLLGDLQQLGANTKFFHPYPKWKLFQ